MRIDSSKALSRAVLFLNGKNLCQRGGEEHRNLKLSQMKRHTKPDQYVHTENCSNNQSGGLTQMRVSNKVVPIYSVSGNWCHMKILDMYLSKLPTDAAVKDIPKKPDNPWFSIVPIGKMVETCAAADISGHKTNHSLRATGASYIFMQEYLRS